MSVFFGSGIEPADTAECSYCERLFEGGYLGYCSKECFINSQE